MHKFLSLKVVEKFVPLMERLGVSMVARSPRGFLSAYRKATGRSDSLTSYWWQRREAFIARHEAQRLQRGEPLYDEDSGCPTRRHLALIAWAYSPSDSLSAFAKRYRG
jgi:hypothetical protein